MPLALATALWGAIVVVLAFVVVVAFGPRGARYFDEHDHPGVAAAIREAVVLAQENGSLFEEELLLLANARGLDAHPIVQAIARGLAQK